MTQYFGDYAEDETVYIPFNTFDSNDPSASVTITNLADADIMVHKDGGTTQIATDGATVAIDFDSITGNHLITVDTSAHADYATGSDYLVRIEGTTVDGATINAWVGSFSIQNRYSAGALRPTTAGRALDVTANGNAGIDWGNVENPTTAVDLSATDIQLADTTTDVTNQVSADVTAISGDSTAADNLELQYDGTGLTGDEYPARQDQVGQLTAGSSGLAVNAGSGTTITTGSETNDYTDTAAQDGTYHIVEDAAGTTDFYYEFDTGSDGICTGIEWYGYVQSNGDSTLVQFYDWVATAWVTEATLDGSNGTTAGPETFNPVNAYTGTGANIGLVRLRFNSTSTTAIATDRIRCVYSQAAAGIANGSTVTLGGSNTNKNYIGRNWTLALGGQDISGSYFFQSTNVTGTATVTNGSGYIFQECNFGAATLSSYGFMELCAFGGTTTFTSTSGVTADTHSLFNCKSNVAGSGAPTFTWAGVTKTTNVNVRKWSGGGTWTFTDDCVASIEVQEGGTHTVTTGGGDVEFRGKPKALALTTSGTGTTNIIVWSGCPITIAGTGGTVNIWGWHGGITDSSSGTTVNDNGGDVTDLPEVLVDTGTTLPAAIADVPTVAEFEARTLPTADYFDPAADTVAEVTLVGTTTTNTDMRGTDNAATAAALATVDGNVDTMVSGIIEGSAATGTLSTTQATTDLSGYADDQLIGRHITVLSGDAEGEQSDITDSAAAGGLLTFTAMTIAMANGDTFKIT